MVSLPSLCFFRSGKEPISPDVSGWNPGTVARREQWIGGEREGSLGGKEQMADPGEPYSCGLVSNKSSKLSLKILYSTHIFAVFMSYNYSLIRKLTLYKSCMWFPVIPYKGAITSI